MLVRGNEVLVKDLGSTNGTFISGQKITEGVLKPGQILRLGQVEVRFESDTSAAATKKTVDHTMVVPQGVKLNDMEQGPRVSGFDTTSKAFSKKSDKANKYFIVFGIIVAVVITVLLFIVYQSIK